LVDDLKKKGLDSELKLQLIELKKSNSLLEVNLEKITRKYQTLEEQERLLRRNY